jgi:hypothetical protein
MTRKEHTKNRYKHHNISYQFTTTYHIELDYSNIWHKNVRRQSRDDQITDNKETQEIESKVP